MKIDFHSREVNVWDSLLVLLVEFQNIAIHNSLESLNSFFYALYYDILAGLDNNSRPDQ